MVNLAILETDGWFVDLLKLKEFFDEEYEENISNIKLISQLLDVGF